MVIFMNIYFMYTFVQHWFDAVKSVATVGMTFHFLLYSSSHYSVLPLHCHLYIVLKPAIVYKVTYWNFSRDGNMVTFAKLRGNRYCRSNESINFLRVLPLSRSACLSVNACITAVCLFGPAACLYANRLSACQQAPVCQPSVCMPSVCLTVSSRLSVCQSPVCLLGTCLYVSRLSASQPSCLSATCLYIASLSIRRLSVC